MMSRIVIRPSLKKEEEVLVRHRRAMFSEMGMGTASERDEADRQYRFWMKKLSKKQNFIAFVAITRSGRVVASGAVWIQDRQPAPGFLLQRPYLMSMYTEKKFRNRGIATAIITQAVEWSRSKGYKSMTLHASVEGLKLYESLGWTRTREYVLSW